MSLLLNKKHLRIETPETVDGINLKYDERNQVVKRISVLPITAHRAFEAIDAKLPAHLRSTITVIDPVPVDEPKKETKTLK